MSKTSLLGFLIGYFKETKRYTTTRFILELTLVAFALKLFFVIASVYLFTILGLDTQTDNDFEKELVGYGFFKVSILVVLFASFETLVGQALTIKLSSFFTKDIIKKILISALVFSLLHIEPLLVAAVFPIGVILAWSYILYRRKSFLMAFYVTTTIHVLHNLVALWLVARSG
ncbi:hypothetical protein HYS93_03890 [Candidatus Daviesbacteria bacterium]|nr:hypothetical protein [Candidatus Daviesbacteria bacterium]